MSKEEEKDFGKAMTEKYFESNKEHHFNFEEFRGDYKVSSGSKILDSYIAGGFGSGLLRFVGPTEAGKTAESLVIQKNFLDTVGESKGIYVKAEGRLSEKMRERSGIKFVTDPKEWELGTTLIFECNIYEVVFDWLRELIKNEKKIRYHIVIDSMDGLIPESALKKSTADAAKIAAGATMTSDFLKRTNLGLAKRGHQCIMMGQVRAEIKDQYAPKDRNKLGGASGGNAAVHFPDWVFEFMRPSQKGDWILPDPEKPPGVDNKPLGRMAKVKFWKSTNDTTGMVISYPIRFGRSGKASIWTEREIVDLLLSWGFIKKKASWLSFDEELAGEVGEFKIQGMDALYAHLEKEQDLVKKLDKFVSDNILDL